MKLIVIPVALLVLSLAQLGCRRPNATRPIGPTQVNDTTAPAASAGRPVSDVGPSILTPPMGHTPLDEQIVQAQEAVRLGRNPGVALERLGWLFVAKARASFDDRCYRLAEQCATGLDERQPGDAGALLLRGHVLHNLHRFKEAEPIARRLAQSRGAPFDHGLLGDVLMEMGQLDEAATAYQRMMDLRPDSRALARAAHLRWLRGDLPGAIEAMQEAVRAVGSRDAESAAWMNTRLGFYFLASGDLTQTERSCTAALQLQTNYAPALLLQGRMHLAEEESEEAIEPLQRAVQINPLPEYQWTLAEALFASGRFDEARAVETALRQNGVAGDGRTYALYLATRQEQVDLALSLARNELQQRADVFTHDALAWCLARAGQLEEARVHLDRALAEGTVDGRLFFHAAVIAAKSGRAEDASRWRARADRSAFLLLPSERRQLQAVVPPPNPGAHSPPGAPKSRRRRRFVWSGVRPSDESRSGGAREPQKPLCAFASLRLCVEPNPPNRPNSQRQSIGEHGPNPCVSQQGRSGDLTQRRQDAKTQRG